MPKDKTILFLYTRLPDYFYQCVRYFVSAYTAKAVIVRYKGDSDTRYSFAAHPDIHLLYKDDLDLPSFIDNLDPDAIVISGWSDKSYRNVSKKYVNRIPVVLAMDNPWLGSSRQKMLTAIAPWFIHRFSNCIWVPGLPQYEYAGRLGFSKDKIYKELYCADTSKFYDYLSNGIDDKSKNYPKTMVFVGRMVEYKQPHVIARVFNEVTKNGNYNWKLILAGEGPLKETIRRQNYSQVEILDFLDPITLPDFYSKAGVFCLPSKGEHWGVAVHEAAAAGLPLLLSDTVESGSEFLINGFNGYSFKTGDEQSLKHSMQLLMNMNPEEMIRMGGNSIGLSKKINHKTWSAILNSIVNNEQ